MFSCCTTFNEVNRAAKMSVATLLLFVAATVAAGAAEGPWWESALVYQIYPRSFKDSNGDGLGDINGIKEKLPYLRDTGVDAIWLSPIYLSPMYDAGYDVTDYRAIAPEYGTMDDFDNLMKEAKRLGLRVILDFVPNHTGNESEWFVKSAERDPAYADYYVWRDGKRDPNNTGKLLPPNNWLSIFRKSAWEYNSVRGQFYLHQYAVAQPDLNYRNPKVHEEIMNALRFWLDKGVSGFRMDAVSTMYEVDPALFGGELPDEPLSGAPDTPPDDYYYLSHIYTIDLNETYYVIYDCRSVLNEYTHKHNESKILLSEAYTSIELTVRYYGEGDREGSIPFNFPYLTNLNNGSNAHDIKAAIDNWMQHMPKGKVANWVNGNHDQRRLASRHGAHRVDAMNALALLLPGVTVTYQGEELGMTDGEVSWEQTQDPQACNTDDPVNYWRKSRDPARTPYHWDSTPNAGFSNTSGTTWLPLADNYNTLNLEAQQKAHKSHYKFYRDVAHIKKGPVVRSGDLHVQALSDHVVAVHRSVPQSSVVGVINLSDENQTVDLSPLSVPELLRVVASGVDCELAKGTMVQQSKVSLSAHCALVLQSHP